jgi:hypothetical protein
MNQNDKKIIVASQAAQSSIHLAYISFLFFV